MGFNYLLIFPPYYVALCASKTQHRLGSESVSWCLETFLFLRLPSRDRAPSLTLLSLFLSFIFFLPPFEDNGLLFWVPDVLCRHQNLFKCSYDEYVGEKVVSPIPPPFRAASASFKFMAAITICSDFGVQRNKVSHCFPFFPIYFP